MNPGAEVWIEGQIPRIAAPGRYVLRFDLVAEGVSWFADRGTIPHTTPIEVTPGAAHIAMPKRTVSIEVAFYNPSLDPDRTSRRGLTATLVDALGS